MQQVTKNDFVQEVKEAKGLVLVDFFAPWCGPCQGMLPLLQELSAELPESQKIVKVNVDDDQELAMEFGVMSIPAFKLFKDGEMVDEAVGAMSKDDVVALMTKHA